MGEAWEKLTHPHGCFWALIVFSSNNLHAKKTFWDGKFSTHITFALSGATLPYTRRGKFPPPFSGYCIFLTH